VRKAPTAENYDINDLHSDDSTDEEDKPKKKIPSWAQGAPLRVAIINQIHHPPDLNQLFGKIDPPDLSELFTKKKPRFTKRTSSAAWEHSILLPQTP
jgi:inner centromere protein